jgi:hypothetical protein
MEHHVRKYSLTHTTPPMRMPIKRELGFDSLTPAGKRILDGTHTPAPGTERYSQLLQKTATPNSDQGNTDWYEH